MTIQPIIALPQADDGYRSAVARAAGALVARRGRRRARPPRGPAQLQHGQAADGDAADDRRGRQTRAIGSACAQLSDETTIHRCPPDVKVDEHLDAAAGAPPAAKAAATMAAARTAKRITSRYTEHSACQHAGLRGAKEPTEGGHR